MQTIPVPSTALEAGEGGKPCTMFASTQNGDALLSGALTRSRGGTLASFLCWGIEPQTGLGSGSFPPAQFPRVVAKIMQDGTIDTTDFCTDW